LRSRLTAARYRDITLVTMDKATAPSDESFDLGVIRREVAKTVESLPESRRNIYRMLTEEHLTVNEIAERLGVSPKTVETQILRSRKKITETLGRLSAFLLFLPLFF
jgi:RNA polymerase sigma-70 factor (ECF subfamily)